MSILESTIGYPSPQDRGPSEETVARLEGLLAGLDRLNSILALPVSPECISPGITFGRFRLRSRIGAGRFGVVLLADDPSLQRQVVVKVPLPAVLADPCLRERFAREARASARLEHSGIVSVFEAGEIEDLPYLAATFVRGPSLRQWRREHPDPIPVTTAVKLVREVASAVQHAHERGVLHCDLAPANVLLQRVTSDADDSQSSDLLAFAPLVTDFGLARLIDEDPNLTQTFQVAGTPLYMSPEQARGDRRNLTSRTDVYALGVLLYDLLAGRPPFLSTEASTVISQVQTDVPEPPRKHVTSVPHDLDAICMKCLEKAPQDRYPSAQALADDLTRFLSGLPVVARPVHPLVRGARWVARNSVAAGLLAVAATLVIVALGVATDRWFKESKTRTELGVAAAERSAAIAHAESLDAQAKTADFYSTLERVRQRRLMRNSGWSPANRADLSRVSVNQHVIDPVIVRTEAAAIAAAFDLAPPRAISVGFSGYSVAFDPSSQNLAIGTYSTGLSGVGVVRIVDPETDVEVRQLNFPADVGWQLRAGGRFDGCWSLAFSPDGKQLVMGTRSGWLIRWDLTRSTSNPIAKWRHSPPTKGGSATAREERITRLAFDSAGRLWSGDEITAAAWDTTREWGEVERQKGTLVREATGYTRHTAGLVDDRETAVHPSGQLVIHKVQRQKLIVCLPDRHPVGRLALPDDERADDNTITDFAVTPDGTTLVATAEHAGHLKLWDLIGSRLLVARSMAPGSLRMAIHPHGHRLAVVESDRVQIFDLIRPTAVTHVGFQPFPLDDVDLTPDGQFLATLGTCPDRGGDFDVQVHDLCQQMLVGPKDRNSLSPPHGNSRLRLAISPDGKEIATHRQGAYVRACPLSDQVTSFEGPLSTRDIRFGSGGKLWAVGTDAVFTWPNGTDKVARIEFSVASMAVGSDGGALVGRNDGTIAMYSPAGEFVRLDRVAPVAITGLAWSGDRIIAGTSAGDILILSEVHREKIVRTISQAHADTIWSVTFGPNGMFATGSADRQVRIWNAEGNELFALAQTRPVRRLFWSADGSRLTVFAEGERAARRWNLERLKAEFTDIGVDHGLPFTSKPPDALLSKSPQP